MATVNKDFVVRNGVIAGDNVQGVQLVSTTSSQPPLTVTSSANVSNLNADLLDGNHGSYFLDWSNTTNKPSPTLTVQLGGALVGTGSVTFTELGNAVLTLNDSGVALDGVTLGIETYGDYVESVNAGTGVTVSHQSGESASPTISIGQDVAISASPTFAHLTLTVPDGTAPISISSSAVIDNLNAEFLSGYTIEQLIGMSGVTSITGTANEVEVSASTGAIQVGLPNDVSIAGSLTVGENLVVTGSVVTINSTVVTIDDPIFTLGGDTAPSVDDNKDRGIEFRYYNGSAKVGFFGFDDSTGKFTFIPDATNTEEVFSGTKGTIDANIEWDDVLSKPDPTITLTGDVSGSGTLTDLGSASISVTVEKDFNLVFTGDVTGSATVSNLGSASISLTVAADSVALGADTTGDYVAGVYGTADQVLVSGSGESASVTLSLPQSIGTSSTPTFAGVNLANAAVTSSSATVSSNNTPTTIDSFTVSTFTTAEYIIQAIQGSKMTSTKILVMWDGTNAYVSEFAIVDSSAGAANVDFSASESSGTLSLTAESPDAASTNVVIKAVRTSLEA
jgi:hypothetical protein